MPCISRDLSPSPLHVRRSKIIIWAMHCLVWTILRSLSVVFSFFFANAIYGFNFFLMHCILFTTCIFPFTSSNDNHICKKNTVWVEWTATARFQYELAIEPTCNSISYSRLNNHTVSETKEDHRKKKLKLLISIKVVSYHIVLVFLLNYLANDLYRKIFILNAFDLKCQSTFNRILYSVFGWRQRIYVIFSFLLSLCAALDMEIVYELIRLTCSSHASEYHQFVNFEAINDYA